MEAAFPCYAEIWTHCLANWLTVHVEYAVHRFCLLILDRFSSDGTSVYLHPFVYIPVRGQKDTGVSFFMNLVTLHVCLSLWTFTEGPSFI